MSPKKIVQKKSMSPKNNQKDEATNAKDQLLEARKRKATPNIFKIRNSKKNTPIVFSLEDVQELIKNKPKEEDSVKTSKPAEKKVVDKRGMGTKDIHVPIKTRVLGAASLSDILGFNPADAKSRPPAIIDENKVPKKFKEPYDALIVLRKHVKEGLDFHSKETLKRSSKDDSGDLSSYSQHMADAGTDTFDRDFALSLVSSEQDALFEIEEAIQRIIDGSYGICEMTGKPIDIERLKAVPFTKYSLEGQKQLESQSRGVNKERGSIFAESTLEDSAKYSDLESED